MAEQDREKGVDNVTTVHTTIGPENMDDEKDVHVHRETLDTEAADEAAEQGRLATDE